MNTPASKMVRADMSVLVPTVNPEQALELLELGFERVHVSAETLDDLDDVAAGLPQDAPVVVVGETAELSRRATIALGQFGIDAVDAGMLTFEQRLVA